MYAWLRTQLDEEPDEDPVPTLGEAKGSYIDHLVAGIKFASKFGGIIGSVVGMAADEGVKWIYDELSPGEITVRLDDHWYARSK